MIERVSAMARMLRGFPLVSTIAVVLLTFGGATSLALAQNIVVVVADDLGVDGVAAYRESPRVGPTPTLDLLAAQGMLFRNAWATPVCSPFRASALSGLHPHQHKVGWAINPGEPERNFGLDPETVTLPRLLGAHGYRTAAVGKWHLATGDGEETLHPQRVGFAHYAGFLWGGVNYFRFPKTVDGATTTRTVYASTDIADDAIQALGGTQPFFLWVAFTAPHGPYHAPPDHLHSFDLSGLELSTDLLSFYKAMIEAMDSELGRILEAVDLANTTVIFVGDNGSKNVVSEPPFPRNHGKGTVYEGGLNVPLIIAGEAVPDTSRGSESAALVQATDLFATVLELAGIEAPPRDSVSVVSYLEDPGSASQREVVFSEGFLPNGGPIDPERHLRAARTERYKLIMNGTSLEFYDLAADPFEQVPLAMDQLSAVELEEYSRLYAAILGHAPRRTACGWGMELPLVLASGTWLVKQRRTRSENDRAAR